jgi:hypothetical protein
MKRKREHKRDLNRILRHVQLNPNRGLLAVVMGMWLDAETPEEQRTTESLMNVFISGKSIRYGDDGDSPTPGGTDRTEVADNAKITSIFSEIMKTTKNPVVLGVQEN